VAFLLLLIGANLRRLAFPGLLFAKLTQWRAHLPFLEIFSLHVDKTFPLAALLIINKLSDYTASGVDFRPEACLDYGLPCPAPSPQGFCRRVLTVVILYAVVRWVMSDHSPRQTWTINSVPAPAAPGATANGTPTPAAKIATPAPPEDLVNGIAVMIVVDVSGSMNESVVNSSGRREPKIAIARRQVLQILGQLQAFAQAHPERPVSVGVASFNGKNTYQLVIRPGPPNARAAEGAVAELRAGGDTAIGDALAAAKAEIDKTKYIFTHIIIVTDGANTAGHDPAKVASTLKTAALPAALYLIGFDVNAKVFDGVKKAGATVLGATNEAQLHEHLDHLLTSQILVERPL